MLGELRFYLKSWDGPQAPLVGPLAHLGSPLFSFMLGELRFYLKSWDGPQAPLMGPLAHLGSPYVPLRVR